MFNLKKCSPLTLPGHYYRIQLSSGFFKLPLELLNLCSLSFDEPLVPLYLRAFNVVDNVHLREFGLSALDLSSDPCNLVLPRPNVALHLPQLVPRQLLNFSTRHLRKVRLSRQMLQLHSQLSAFVLL